MRCLRWLLVCGGVAGLCLFANPFLADSAVQDPGDRQSADGRRLATELVKQQPRMKAVYEQIEILKRVLSRKLAIQHSAGYGFWPADSTVTVLAQNFPTTPPSAKPAGSQSLYNPNPVVANGSGYFYTTGGTVGASEIDGFYLPGTGLFLTMQLSHADRIVQTGSRAVAPADLWEQARQEVTGAAASSQPKAEPKKEPETSLKDQLVDRILATLAEYSDRLTGLASGDRVTVVVTLRGSAIGYSINLTPHYDGLSDPVALAGAAPAALGQVSVNAGNNLQPVGENAQVSSTQASVTGPESFAVATAQPSGETSQRGEEGDRHLKLGDLHIKQGRYEDARTAYREAIRAFERDENRAQLVLAYRRLAEAYLQQNKLDEVDKILSRMREVERRPAGVRPAGSAHGIPTQKLIVSISLEALRSARGEKADGRIDAEALRRQASVDLVDVPESKSFAPPPVSAPQSTQPVTTPPPVQPARR